MQKCLALNNYKVIYSHKAAKQLQKLDKFTSRTIYAWIDKNLQNCLDPRRHGKALSANLSGLWRYRVGDYRLLAEIQDDKIIILILTVGHRRDVYEV